MGELSRFYGMIIWMYSGDHDPPHIHVLCSGKVSRVCLDGKILENNLPSGKYKILKEWTSEYRNEL
jgi:Domain of unknown function (DUF4160)